MRYLILLLFSVSLISCGPLNTINSNNSDGIYGDNVEVLSNNSAFYKNYFEQKSDELGLNSNLNDSVVTDIDSYSSNTNITYNSSNGSWGDNPTSVNIIFKERYIYSPYISGYPYANGWYDNYYYNPYNYWNWNRINYSPWRFNYPRIGYGYGYRYGILNNWWHPYYNSPAYDYPNYDRNKYTSNAYMKGKRGSSFYNDQSSLDKSLNNYNVGRNGKNIKSESIDKSKKSDEIKNRNINRIYYAIKNSRTNDKPARGYQNRGVSENYGNSQNDTRTNTSRSNFQASKYGQKTRSYDVSRSSKGKLRNYSRTELKNKTSNNNVKSYSRTEINTNSSGTSRTRSSYSPSISRSSSSSVGTRPISGSSSGSRSSARGRR